MVGFSAEHAAHTSLDSAHFLLLDVCPDGSDAGRETGHVCGTEREFRGVSDKAKPGWRGRAERKKAKVNLGAEASIRRRKGRAGAVEGTVSA